MPQDQPIAIAVVSFLALCRVGAALRLIPFFGGEPMPPFTWLSLSVVITYVLVPWAGGSPIAWNVSPIGAWTMIAALALKEIFVGIVIGTTCRIAFSVLEAVGRLAQQATFSTAASSGDEVFSKLYTMIGIGALLLIGGHHTFLLGFSATLKCIPLEDFPTALSAPEAILRLFGSVMAGATSAALPIFAASMISDLLVSSVSKFLSDPITSTADALRGAAAQCAILLSFGAAVRISLQLIMSSLDRLMLCP